MAVFYALNYILVPECPDGLSCDNTIESHYKNYSHRRLAFHRSTNPESAKSQVILQQMQC